MNSRSLNVNRFNVRKVAVLGAGVMGAQIAAHLVNCKVPVVLFDLPAKEGPKNGIALKAIEGLKKLKPAPLGVPEGAALIQQANYEEHLEQLAGCDLVIEAIAERMDWKLDLYRKIAPHVAPHAIVASNTSGLSITKLSASACPRRCAPRFCGIHFFNPPRYMALVELIPTPSTLPEVLDQLEAFVTSGLGKGVVRAKDTPNFIANRVGIAGMLARCSRGQLRPELRRRRRPHRQEAGPRQQRHLPHRRRGGPGHDGARHQDAAGHARPTPTRSMPATPRRPVLAKLLAAGALGQKTGAGFYKKVGKDIQRFDPATGGYAAAGGKADEIVARMLKKPAPSG
jgi:3-hydroxyacyl-CoA dehydrogenase